MKGHRGNRVLETLSGSLVTLKRLTRKFVPDYLSMFSECVAIKLHVPSVQNEAQYIADRLKRPNCADLFFYCIFENDSNQLIGALEIRDAEEYPGQLYTWLNQEFWGGNRFQEAMRLAVDYYFQKTNQPQIIAHVDVNNARSYRALKKAGFADIGMKNGPSGKQYVLLLRKK